jgi:putative FmdB family regulatory protein
MPIYAYKCSACQHELDVLQKISDAPLTICPSCGAPALAKQLTAAGFQLKGSGWYVTDFRNSGAKPESKPEGKAEGKAEAKAEGKPEVKPDAAPASKPADAAPAAAPAPAAGDGTAAS